VILRIGKRFAAPVADLAEASRVYQRERDASGEGGSTFPVGRVGSHRISYNGKVWGDPAMTELVMEAAEPEVPRLRWRIERFHLTSDRAAVVIPHPQAASKVAMEQGYVVLRFEPATSDAFRDRVVRALNAADITAPEVWAHGEESDVCERCREAFPVDAMVTDRDGWYCAPCYEASHA
jgi:hypothetical protein